MEENFKFLTNQKERIEEALTKLNPSRETQKYVNLISCETNLVGFLSQLEGLIKARKEAEKRERLDKEAYEEAAQENK